MGTQIGSKSDETFGLIGAIIVGIMFFIGFGIMIPKGQAENQKQREQADCQQYGADSIQEIPARCVTPQGGFKAQSQGGSEGE